MKVLLFLGSFLILNACSQSSDKKMTEIPSPAPIPAPIPASNPPAPPITPDSQYPTAGFEFNEYIWTSPNIDLHGHVILSRAFNEAIALDVSLVDLTAQYPRDYLGFYGLNSRSYTIVFAPGERLMHLNSIDVSNSPVCGGKFLMKLSAGPAAKVILGSPAEILLNCK